MLWLVSIAELLEMRLDSNVIGYVQPRWPNASSCLPRPHYAGRSVSPQLLRRRWPCARRPTRAPCGDVRSAAARVEGDAGAAFFVRSALGLRFSIPGAAPAAPGAAPTFRALGVSRGAGVARSWLCLLYTCDAADE